MTPLWHRAIGASGRARRDARVRDAQLPEAFERLAVATRSGRSVGTALEEVATSTAPPLGPELHAVTVAVAAGAPVERVIAAWAGADPTPDLLLATTALALGARAGGEVARACDRVAATLPRATGAADGGPSPVHPGSRLRGRPHRGAGGLRRAGVGHRAGGRGVPPHRTRGAGLSRHRPRARRRRGMVDGPHRGPGGVTITALALGATAALLVLAALLSPIPVAAHGSRAGGRAAAPRARTRSVDLAAAGVAALVLGLAVPPLAVVALAVPTVRRRLSERRASAQRLHAIGVALPETVDLLLLCTGAGMTLPLALPLVGPRAPTRSGPPCAPPRLRSSPGGVGPTRCWSTSARSAILLQPSPTSSSTTSTTAWRSAPASSAPPSSCASPGDDGPRRPPGACPCGSSPRS